MRDILATLALAGGPIRTLSAFESRARILGATVERFKFIGDHRLTYRTNHEVAVPTGKTTTRTWAVGSL